MKWRPEGWDNPYLGVDEDGFDKEYQGYDSYEAGADEMLEGLFKMARESPTGTFTIDVREQNKYMENNNAKE